MFAVNFAELRWITLMLVSTHGLFSNFSRLGNYAIIAIGSIWTIAIGTIGIPV